MVAHLAGTLGRRGIVLLKHDADWRWMRGERCAWYPSLRLLRQAAPGDWSVPLRRLRACEVPARPPLHTHCFVGHPPLASKKVLE
jgi:hypothetical protein